MTTNACQLCNDELQNAPKNSGDSYYYACPNCGNYSLSGTQSAVMGAAQYTDTQRALLSAAVRRMASGGGQPMLTSDLAETILGNTQLPNAMEQQERLIVFLGETLVEPGQVIDLKAGSMRATLGSITTLAAGWVLRQAFENGSVQGHLIQSINGPYELIRATLSIQGWQTFGELQRSPRAARGAFMAMKFYDSELTNFFKEHLKPAVARAGFNLTKLDDAPRAGLIDDRLRLEIRTSRFLIADLSHGNPGAYWEAGYAEGLGRPVIYTCRKDVFEDPEAKPHFDTNHHLTVVWDPAEPQKAAEELTTIIRVTLPDEAKLTDD